MNGLERAQKIRPKPIATPSLKLRAFKGVVICFQEKKGAMKVKRLKKKVVDEFVRQNGDTFKTRIQLEVKVEKKIKKNKEFKFVKETVSLATSRD